jgi:hypothetical protein
MTRHGRAYVCAECSSADLGHGGQVDGGQVPHVDARFTVTHPNGITQVFRSAGRERVAGEPAVGAFQRDGDAYRTYNVDGSSLGSYASPGVAYAAVKANDGIYTAHDVRCSVCQRRDHKPGTYQGHAYQVAR